MNKSEFGLIEWVRRQGLAGGEGVVVGIGDDMAVVEVGGEKVLITTDMLLEGVHFELAGGNLAEEHAYAARKHATLQQVGYKAMACSLSDCAAMAVRPWVAVVSVALPGGMSMEEAKELHEGMQRAAEKYACPLVGGDTVSWDRPLAINVSMLAKLEGNEPVLRSGARVGDAILVTGELGGSRQGKHLEFEPRVAEALKLARMVELHAMIDISDGLSIDLDHICQESKVGAVIEAAVVPVSAAARQSADPLGAALSDGEDFELLFCVGAEDAEKLMEGWYKESTVKISRIGEIVEIDGKQQDKDMLMLRKSMSPRQEGGRLFIRDKEGKLEILKARGWEHFI